MKRINKDELFEHLSGFLKTKGIELKAGSYAQGIQKSCSILADAVNLGQQGLERAKDGLDKNLDKVRRVIHEKTAPKPPPGPGSPPKAQPTSVTAEPAPKARSTQSRRTKARKPRKTGK